MRPWRYLARASIKNLVVTRERRLCRAHSASLYDRAWPTPDGQLSHNAERLP